MFTGIQCLILCREVEVYVAGVQVYSWRSKSSKSKHDIDYEFIRAGMILYVPCRTCYYGIMKTGNKLSHGNAQTLFQLSQLAELSLLSF